MKKVITILVVVLLLATTLAITVPASAESDKGVLYEAALVSLRYDPSGPVVEIFGKATVYDNFEVEFEIEDVDAPDVTYEVKISYGYYVNRQLMVLGTITADGDGRGEGCFDLTLLPNPPGPMPPSVTLLFHPGFSLIRPNLGPGPPYIFYSNQIIIPPPAP